MCVICTCCHLSQICTIFQCSSTKELKKINLSYHILLENVSLNSHNAQTSMSDHWMAINMEPDIRNNLTIHNTFVFLLAQVSHNKQINVGHVQMELWCYQVLQMLHLICIYKYMLTFSRKIFMLGGVEGSFFWSEIAVWIWTHNQNRWKIYAF